MAADRPGALGDMGPEEFRRHGHALVDWIAAYLSQDDRYPVLSRAAPGDIRERLPAGPPEAGAPFDAIFADFERHLLPGITHWNHPGFFAYFAISGSGPGVLAELLAAALNVQAMLWRTSPAATELEEVALGWLRQLLGLPAAFRGGDLRHRLGGEPARARGGPRGGPPRRPRRRAGRTRRAGPVPRLPVRACALVDRQGRDDAGPRAARAAADRRRRGVPHAARRPARGRCRRSRGRPDAAGGRRHGRHDLHDQRRPGARDRGRVRGRGDLAARGRRVRRRRRARPRDRVRHGRLRAGGLESSSTRTSGCSPRSI